jgi:hypothetical protein
MAGALQERNPSQRPFAFLALSKEYPEIDRHCSLEVLHEFLVVVFRVQ